MTTSTAPRPTWQACARDGIGHLFVNTRPSVGVAVCDPGIPAVHERFTYPVRAKCTRCLAIESRPLDLRVRTAGGHL